MNAAIVVFGIIDTWTDVIEFGQMDEINCTSIDDEDDVFGKSKYKNKFKRIALITSKNETTVCQLGCKLILGSKLCLATNPAKCKVQTIRPRGLEDDFDRFNVCNYFKLRDLLSYKSLVKNLQANELVKLKKQLNPCKISVKIKVRKQLFGNETIGFYIVNNLLASEAINILSYEQYVGTFSTLIYYKQCQRHFDWLLMDYTNSELEDGKQNSRKKKNKVKLKLSVNSKSGSGEKRDFNSSDKPRNKFADDVNINSRCRYYSLYNPYAYYGFDWFPIETIAICAFIYSETDVSLISELNAQIENKANSLNMDYGKLVRRLLNIDELTYNGRAICESIIGRSRRHYASSSLSQHHQVSDTTIVADDQIHSTTTTTTTSASTIVKDCVLVYRELLFYQGNFDSIDWLNECIEQKLGTFLDKFCNFNSQHDVQTV